MEAIGVDYEDGEDEDDKDLKIQDYEDEHMDG